MNIIVWPVILHLPCSYIQDGMHGAPRPGGIGQTQEHMPQYGYYMPTNAANPNVAMMYGTGFMPPYAAPNSLHNTHIDK